MNINPLQMMQMLSQINNSQNPLQVLQGMYGNNPAFSRAMEMAKGKSPAELENTVKNLCKQSNIDFEQMKNMMKSMGMRL